MCSSDDKSEDFFNVVINIDFFCRKCCIFKSFNKLDDSIVLIRNVRKGKTSKN